MYHVANMWYAPREKYHEYKIKPAEDGNYSTPVIMIQGDSFAEGLFKDISNSRITENCYYVYNDRFISDINDQKVIDVRNVDKESYKNIWDLFNLEYYIDEIDVLCIEFNPSFMNTESSGFVYYLNTLLGD